jgi:hypothetical protein
MNKAPMQCVVSCFACVVPMMDDFGSIRCTRFCFVVMSPRSLIRKMQDAHCHSAWRQKFEHDSELIVPKVYIKSPTPAVYAVTPGSTKKPPTL